MLDKMLYKFLDWCNKAEDKLRLNLVIYREGVIGYGLGLLTCLLLKIIFWREVM
jgi:hypothetical protein